MPDLAQHIILEFIGYKLRNCRYIKQLKNEKLDIIEKLLFDSNKYLEFEYKEKEMYDENTDEYYIEEYRYIYFWISSEIRRKRNIEKYIVLRQSIYDSNDFYMFNEWFDVDFDGSKHDYGPIEPWK